MTAASRAELAARPDLVDEVLPDYPALGKRILQDNGWFRTLLRGQRRAGQGPDRPTSSRGPW